MPCHRRMICVLLVGLVPLLALHADWRQFRGPTGQPTTLRESIFSTVPGSPAYVGKASSYRQQTPELNQDIDLKGHNAILSDFRFDHQAAA